MDPALMNLIEPVVVLATLFGVAFGLKLFVWGKGPFTPLKGGPAGGPLERRVAELEDQLLQLSDALGEQRHRLDDHDERLDFAERMVTRRRADGLSLPPLGAPTPV